MLLFKQTDGARGARPTGAVRLNRMSPLARGLVAFVPLNGETRDLVGLIGTPAAFNGPTPIGNTMGGFGYNFVAANDQYVNLGNPSVLNFPTAFTANFWVSLGASPACLLSKDKDTGGRSFTVDYSGGNLRFYVNGAANGLLSSSLLSSGVPAMVTVNFDTLNTTIALHVNGRPAASGTDGSPASIFTSTANVLVARREYAGFENPSDAQIWDVGFWNRPLTDAEVWALYDPSTRYDLYAAPSSRVFFAFTAGGGTVYNVTLALSNLAALAPTGPLTISGSVGMGTSSGIADGAALTIPQSLTLTAVAALAAQAGFLFVQSLSLALTAAVTNALQRAHNLSIALAESTAVAPSSTQALAASVALTGQPALTASATEIVTQALALAVTGSLSGFAGFAYAGSIALGGQTALAASMQRAINVAIALAEAASLTPAAQQAVVASIVAAVTAACNASATQAIAAQTALVGKAALVPNAGFQLTVMLQLLVAGQLATAYTYQAAGATVPITIQMVAEALTAAAMADLGLLQPGITGESIH